MRFPFIFKATISERFFTLNERENITNIWSTYLIFITLLINYFIFNFADIINTHLSKYFQRSKMTSIIN